jgi:hypothetical protein
MVIKECIWLREAGLLEKLEAQIEAESYGDDEAKGSAKGDRPVI